MNPQAASAHALSETARTAFWNLHSLCFSIVNIKKITQANLQAHFERVLPQSASDSTDTAPLARAHFSNPGGGFLIPNISASLISEIFSHLQLRKSAARKSVFERFAPSRSESLRFAPFRSASSKDDLRKSALRKSASRKFAELRSANSSRDSTNFPLRTSAPRKFARCRSAPPRSIP